MNDMSAHRWLRAAAAPILVAAALASTAAARADATTPPPVVEQSRAADRAEGFPSGNIERPEPGTWLYALENGILAGFLRCDASGQCGAAALSANLGEAPLYAALQLKRLAQVEGFAVTLTGDGGDFSRPTPVILGMDLPATARAPSQHPAQVRALLAMSQRAAQVAEDVVQGHCFVAPRVVLEARRATSERAAEVLVPSTERADVYLALDYLRDKSDGTMLLLRVSVMLPGMPRSQPFFDGAQVYTDGEAWDTNLTVTAPSVADQRVGFLYRSSAGSAVDRLLAAKSARIYLLRQGRKVDAYEFDLRSLPASLPSLRASGFNCPAR